MLLVRRAWMNPRVQSVRSLIASTSSIGKCITIFFESKICFYVSPQIFLIRYLAGTTGKCHAPQATKNLELLTLSEFVFEGAYVDGLLALIVIARGPYLKGMDQGIQT